MEYLTGGLCIQLAYRIFSIMYNVQVYTCIPIKLQHLYKIHCTVSVIIFVNKCISNSTLYYNLWVVKFMNGHLFSIC